ncbi:MAG TPA: N(4)-(beta-N-acetylglucosaminyl)-L-asparaginase [Blastocatellia bacterium]|nr:N(4)-(beta-N-acetylglucosaminyl)-L-asparaginase [Blastocatellia bacterium]
MAKKISRRDFVKTSAVIGLVAEKPGLIFGKAPSIKSSGVKPLVISAANGNHYKNGGTVTAVEKAFSMITGGSDVLDAVIAGVNIVELDPEESSVGYGGLPNAEGVVQLDASCMHGPKRMAGGVACIEGVRTPSLVAQAVMDQTDHILLVGKGAQDFARQMGFKIEDDLNTPKSRRLYLEWKRRTDPEHYLDPKKREEVSHAVSLQMVKEGLIDPQHLYGTINCNGINLKGDICGVTTTSGLAWKIPGRVGDSPIIGAGLYLNNDIGAAGSTGRGEANLFNLSSYYVVECMRGGMHPKDAGMAALKRVKEGTIEKRLLNEKGEPNFTLEFYVLNKRGEYAAVSMYKSQFALCTENGPETLQTEPLLEGKP